MYLHLGKDTVVRTESIIGIFDIENSTVSRITRTFLGTAQKNNHVINVSMEMPKSFILCKEKGKERKV